MNLFNDRVCLVNTKDGSRGDGSGCRTSHAAPAAWLPGTRVTRPTHASAGSRASQEVQVGCGQRLNQPRKDYLRCKELLEKKGKQERT